MTSHIRTILEQDSTGLWCFLGKNIREFPEKKLDGRQKKFLVDGRERNIARFFIRGGGWVVVKFV